MHKDDGVPLRSAKQEENSIFIVQGWGFSPALFVAVKNPQFLPVGHYLVIEDNREMRE